MVGIVADGGLLAAARRLTTRAWLRCLWEGSKKQRSVRIKQTLSTRAFAANARLNGAKEDQM